MARVWSMCQNLSTWSLCWMSQTCTDSAEFRRKVASGREIEVAISSLVKSRILLLECAKVLHEALLVPVLLYGSESVV